jgi:hypothetical protein
VGVIDRAVQRIDYPAKLGGTGTAAALFGENLMVGEQLLDAADERSY